ncbi:hypothetical protein A9404_04220 [Halothiobacillus diazotrophicus]|uniref:Diguanylate cyclase DosC n=1 Tax=Halothiobacillus diazotrophicus TaxID=1860122 RepID=A0A191ZFQ6_9GAMM|nr:EAL domain-containing protein [Halothiobacillus diazotrophicus]ANJ66690.1 hypothetical protein A9404_04220 [Halothiobacillus diazotrophicus]
MSSRLVQWPGVFYRLLLTLPLLMLVGWASWNESTQYQLAVEQIDREADHAGRFYANRIENRLNSAYKELELIAPLIAEAPNRDTPTPQIQHILQHLQQLHPEIYAIGVDAGNGKTRLWSTPVQHLFPYEPDERFTSLKANPQWLLGPGQIVNRTPLIALRYRPSAPDGGSEISVNLIYRLGYLLDYPPEEKAWQFTVVDTRNNRILGICRNGTLDFQKSQSPEGKDTVPIHGYPMIVRTTGTEALAKQIYRQSAKKRLDLYIGMFVLLGIAAWGIYTLLRQRERDADHLKRLADINALLAQVNQIIAVSRDETGFMEEICALAVKYGGFRLAFIAKPDKTGQFQILAAADSTGYTRNLQIVTDPELPEGQGPVGTAWRTQQPVYAQDLRKTPGFNPWLQKAEQFGIRSSATIPIRKNGARWAILAAYHAENQVFTGELEHLLEDLAQDITRGLNWIETQRREAVLQATQRALLDNTLAGIAMVRDRHLIQVTARLVIMLGYVHADELLGQSTRVMYATDADYDRVGQGYEKLLIDGKIMIPDVRFARKDGSTIICDLSASMIQDDELTTSVWTIQDITKRHNLQKELAKTLAYQRTLFDNNAAALLTVDTEGNITDANPALCLLTGYSHGELVGHTADMLQDVAEAPQSLTMQFKALADGPAHSARQEGTIRHRDGTILNVETLGASLTLPDGRSGAIWSLIDVTALHQAKQEIAYQALHDTLTGLPNRRALEQHLPRAIARAQRHGTVVAVGMLDLDDFKPVNDNFGHESGDTLLRELAQRLKARLRKQDLLARLGGDEFVIVLEDLEQDQLLVQLETALDRLHQSVETPFDVSKGKQAKIGMSLGLALYPIDGDQGDSLLRLADAALYASKTNKSTRTQWWRIIHDTPPADSTRTEARESYFDAYSPESQALMHQCAAYLDEHAERFVRQFYAALRSNPGAQKILETIAPTGLPRLVTIQVEHLRFLLNPETTRAQLVARAKRIGTVHALVGVGSPLLMQSMNLYGKLLNDYLNQAPLNSRERHQIMIASEARIQDDILEQLQAGGATIQEHFDLLTHPLPPAESLWVEVKTQEIERLGQLPGIQAILLMRPDADGVFTIEGSGGHHGATLASLLNDRERRANIDPESPRGKSLAAEAWRTLDIQSSPNLHLDPHYAEWHGIATQLEVTAAISLPIMDSNRRVIAVLMLYGRYPNQFESVWMQQFTRNLQLRLSQVWLLCNNPGPVISQQLAQHYRRELFSGGLRVHMQPILDLRDGSLIKVEALARLARPDGTIVPPGDFLPLLGDSELDRLFCLVMETALPWLRRWDRDGITVDLSINLSPGTLIDPECSHWIEDALKRTGIPAQRLTLEILETQGLDEPAQDAAIRKLVDMGIPLAMDDLGSGYSSLYRLATLPFNIIKIDQSLVTQLRANPVQTMSLISAIIQMGNDFDQTVIVEGLEERGFIEVVTILGAQYGQGYGLARPMPPEEILPWLDGLPPHQPTPGFDTYLGALAYHWWLMHTGRRIHPEDMVKCPLNRFLIDKGHGDSEAATWHRETHAAQENRTASRNLLVWLAEHVQAESRTESPFV